MKKLLTILLAALMVLTLAGCSEKEQEEENPVYHIGVATYQFNDNFMTYYRNDIADYFKALNDEAGYEKYVIQIVDGKNDANEQTEQVNSFISQGVDGLIVNLVQTSSDALANAVTESGIPTVFINREIANYTYTDTTCYVGADAKQSGFFQGKLIADLPDHGDINGDGTISYIMIMGDPENSDAQNRTVCSIQYLTDAGYTVKELYKETANWDQTQGNQLVTTALEKFGTEIEVVFCNNDGMALGAYQAIESAGRKVGEDIYLVGVDDLPEASQLVKEGKMTGTVLNDDINQCKACCESLLKMMNGEVIENKVNYIDYLLISPANVDTDGKWQ